MLNNILVFLILEIVYWGYYVVAQLSACQVFRISVTRHFTLSFDGLMVVYFAEFMKAFSTDLSWIYGQWNCLNFLIHLFHRVVLELKAVSVSHMGKWTHAYIYHWCLALE